MLYIWTHKKGNQRVTVAAETPQKAVESFVQIVRAYFPELMKARWTMEVKQEQRT